MRKNWSVIIALILPVLVIGQNVSITGNASFYANEQITVFRFKSRLTNEKIKLESTKISDDGLFNLNLDLTNAQELVFKIEMREVVIPVHPGSIVTLNFLPLKNADNQRLAMVYEVEYVEVPKNAATDSVYASVKIKFAKTQSNIHSKSNILDIYTSFFTRTDSIVQQYSIADSLFKSYYTYFKASAYLVTNASKTGLINKYIHNQPIHYQSKEYLKFFRSVMVPRVNQVFIRNKTKFENALNEYQIHNALLDILKLDTLLQSKEIRSLALFNYVNSKASNLTFSKEQKLAVMGQMANFCQFSYQKDAAQFYRKKKKKLQVNSEAPIFELEDQYGQKLSLQKFRGKPVYLGFINSKSRTCYTDLLVIDQLRKKYKKIEFLMVLTDRDSVDMKLLPEEASNFNYLFLDKNYSILETYQIWSYPVYYLLDNHGYFLESPSSRPEEMYSVFKKMFAKKSRRKRYEIIKD